MIERDGMDWMDAGWEDEARRAEEERVTFDIDLKWSLWCAHPEDIEERAPEALAAMRRAFDGTGPVAEVRTAPKKEIRFGTVVVRPGEAWVHFYCQWDDPYELAHGWNEGDLDEEAWGEVIPARMVETVRAATFEELLRAIDGVEDRLLQEGGEEVED